MLRKLNTLFAVTISLVLCLSIVAAAPQPKASALAASDFDPGRIIDDEVFFNSSLMSIPDIQNFLNSKVPVCDTNGTQPYAGTTRAAYGASRGYPAPFTCLKDYVQVGIPQKDAESGLCTGIGSGTKSAAEIIYVVSRSCGINPQVLIVLLQKEQSLITDDWPWSIQYRSATGYGCPDTAPCDANYYGFFNQVYNAARQFKRYARDANLFSYQKGRNNYIQYNPNAGCGGTNIFIRNQATAGLYNYTPYQPNPAALSGLSDSNAGGGDGCSAYGNRNFFWYFSRWFGSTIAGACTANEPTLSYVRRFYNPRTFDHFYSARDCDVSFLAQIGYINEGPVFNTTPATSPLATPVYRLYNPRTQMHLWTTHYETPEQLAAGRTGYQQEAGIVFYVLPGGISNPPNQAHSFYNPNTYLHFLVANPTQADKDWLYHKAGYLYEGPSFNTQ